MAAEEASATITREPVWVDPSKIIYPREKPLVPPPIAPGVVPEVIGKKRLILNIETTGYRPWEHRIIAIGLQDPLVPNLEPVVLMDPSERMMIASLFMVIKEGGYDELVGYGLSFDYRFLLIKAMKHNLTCKEFYDIGLYDLMQAAAQGKFSYVYYPQKAPSLSDLADYLWSYPKPFTDLEMIKYYAQEQYDKVYEFASGQITRIFALYTLFTRITQNPTIDVVSGSVGSSSSVVTTPKVATESLLTIPEAHLPELVRLQCPNCMAEKDFPAGTTTAECTICDGVMSPI